MEMFAKSAIRLSVACEFALIRESFGGRFVSVISLTAGDSWSKKIPGFLRAQSFAPFCSIFTARQA
jgi:hypothetical protein